MDDLAEPFRRPVEQQLAALPGQHLVLVRYSKDHNSGEEYVYNDADIDHAKTVWAREIPGVDVSPLLAYFRNRDVWLFEPDEDDRERFPYSPHTIASHLTPDCPVSEIVIFNDRLASDYLPSIRAHPPINPGDSAAFFPAPSPGASVEFLRDCRPSKFQAPASRGIPPDACSGGSRGGGDW